MLMKQGQKQSQLPPNFEHVQAMHTEGKGSQRHFESRGRTLETTSAPHAATSETWEGTAGCVGGGGTRERERVLATVRSYS